MATSRTLTPRAHGARCRETPLLPVEIIFVIVYQAIAEFFDTLIVGTFDDPCTDPEAFDGPPTGGRMRFRLRSFPRSNVALALLQASSLNHDIVTDATSRLFDIPRTADGRSAVIKSFQVFLDSGKVVTQGRRTETSLTILRDIFHLPDCDWPVLKGWATCLPGDIHPVLLQLTFENSRVVVQEMADEENVSDPICDRMQELLRAWRPQLMSGSGSHTRRRRS